jgi:hypothetical protein
MTTTRRRRTTWALAGLLAVVPSCARDPIVQERAVFIHSPAACPVFADDAYSVIYAGGDFEPSQDRPPIASVFLRELGRSMEDLPNETRSLVVDVSQHDADWRGVTNVSEGSGPINVLVWPGEESCRLTLDVERRSDGAFGVFGHHVMITGGLSKEGGQVPNTYVGDLTTGIIDRLPFGLKTRRSRATITSFRDPRNPDAPATALVAGGEDPQSRVAIQSAEVYVGRPGVAGEVGDFLPERIDLVEARTDHGAVVLNTGETLLVGGRGAGGPLNTMEIIEPQARRARSSGLGILQVARTKPKVIRLANGEILVAGGVDANNQPVSTLEWFAPDASRRSKRPVDLVAGKERSIVPLEGGGALAVIIPQTSTPDFKNVWVVSADGTLEPGVPIDPALLDVVRLFPGSDGAPVLWTGQRWMRWAPWYGAFQTISGAPSTGPALDATTNGDGGLALWLDERDGAALNIAGYRFAARTPFDAVPKPLLVRGPDQLAPDRLASGSGGSIHFDAERGLFLGPGASAFLTDVTFLDFALDVDVATVEGQRTPISAVVVIRDESGMELEVGGASCAFAQATQRHLAIRRTGAAVEANVDDGEWRACPTQLGATTRVAIGLRGAQSTGSSGAKNLRVVRR